MLSSLVEAAAPYLSHIHLIFGLIGFFLTVYVMVFISYEREDIADPVWLQWCRRISYAVVALAMMWSLNYQVATGWGPWPPAVLLMFGLILMMAVRAAAVHLRIMREGHRRPMSHVSQHNKISRDR